MCILHALAPVVSSDAELRALHSVADGADLVAGEDLDGPTDVEWDAILGELMAEAMIGDELPLL